MQKDFDKWNSKKKNIDKHTTSNFFHEREIWWCSLGINIGFEQDGKGEVFERPVVIIKKFNNNCFLGVPLTTKEKQGKYYYNLGEVGGVNATAVLSQIKFYDAKRLTNKIETLPYTDYDKIIKALKEVCFP